MNSGTTNKILTGRDTWTGGSIELLLLFKQTPDLRVLDVLKVAWAWPSLTGPFLNNTVEPSEQERAAIQDLEPEQPQTLYGVATLPNGSSAAFACHVICDDEGTWIYLGSPLGSLGNSYAVGAYPLEGSPTDPWAKDVYGWLAELAQWVFRQIKFSSGVIGWLTTVELDELLSGSIPERRYQGYLVAADNDLKYLPPNVSEPLLTFDDR